MSHGGATLALDTLPVQNGFRLRGSEMTRLETFTDAAFAFALTLLVISLEPTTDLRELLVAMREIPAFFLSATQLMMFWWGHHEWSRRYGLDDGPTIVLSCLLVFTVLIYVVPLRFMFGVFTRWIGFVTGLPIGSTRVEIWGPQDVNTILLVYAIGFVAMSLSLVLLYVHAWRSRTALGLNAVEMHDTRVDLHVWAVVAGAGVLSALVALAVPASMVGLPGWVYMILPVATPVIGMRADRERRRLTGEEEEG